MLEWLFRSGVVAYLALLWLIVEALLLWRLFAPQRPGLQMMRLLPNYVAGGALLLALAAALSQSSWPWLAGWLSIGLIAHLADLRTRLIT